jgi:cell division protein FtsA
VITGGSALIPAITRIAKNCFDVPCRVGYPRGLEGLVDEITGPAYSVAQGLIVYGMNDVGAGSRTRAVGGKVVGGSDSGGSVFKKLGGFIKNLLP